MSNLCENRLEVFADESLPKEERTKLLQEFLSAFDLTMNFSFSQFLPIPEKVLRDGGRGIWMSDNWGCRGDADCVGPLNYDGDIVWKEFDTPSSPPINAIEALAQKHPLLNFTLFYAEPGAQFAGLVDWAGGELVDEEYCDFDDPEEIAGLSEWHSEKAEYYADMFSED
jgi:hypothetical protein